MEIRHVTSPAPGAKWITLPSGARRVELVLDVGLNPITGDRRQVRRRYRTVEAAQAAYLKIANATNDGILVTRSSRITVDQACGDWLTSRRSLRKGALANYANSLKPVRRTYGPLPLEALTVKHIDALITELQAGRVARVDGRQPRQWKPASVNLMLRVLSLMLEHARKQGLVTRNVAALVDRVPDRRDPRPTYTPEEIKQLMPAVRRDPLEHAWHLALCGLRRGEVCGLRWDDIDLDEGTLTVRQARVSVDGEVMVEDPKTRAGRRTLPLTDEVAKVLVRARRRQVEDRLCAGARWAGSGYLIVDDRGRPLHPETVSDKWDEFVTGAGVRRIRLHDARHTCGTLMHLQGVPVAVIAAWLGHANAAFTMQVYVHSQNPALKDAAQVLNGLTAG